MVYYANLPVDMLYKIIGPWVDWLEGYVIPKIVLIQ